MGAALALPIAYLVELFASQTPALNYCWKWLVSYFYVRLYKRLATQRFDIYENDAVNEPVKVGFVESPVEIQFESPYPESHLLKGTDEVFFYGVNSKSECLITRVARSCQQEAEAWIYLKLANGKVYQLIQTTNYQQSTSEKNCFTCGGLQMHYLSPMRRWRIFFNGLLRETPTENGNEEKMVYVKFSLIWRASSDVFDLTTDLNPVQLANALAGTTWNGILPPLNKLYDTLNFYSQAGVTFGTVSIGDNQEEQELYLFGERMRFVGETSYMNGAEFVQIFGHVPKNGSFLHLGKTSIPNVVNNLCFGYVVQPDAQIKTITDADVYMRDHFEERRKKKNDVTAIFQADDAYELTGIFVGEKSHFKSNIGWGGSLIFNNISLQLNVNKGSGVVIEGKVSKVLPRSFKKSTISRFPKQLPLAVEFMDETSSISEISGGKGSSLGVLAQLSKTLQTFIVPKGFVVSTAAYKEFINEDILKDINKLENFVYGNVEGDVKLACKKVSDEIIKAKIPGNVFKAIRGSLQKTFGAKMDSLKFAIRSSATGEDTEQMSAAGQMETFLGISGLDEIVDSVKKCWASQFGYIAVQYKKRNGQILNSPMAVVIQEIVPCDVAGVLFTCDPVSGNPSLISITANYGLGESVVSGTEEPDTIELQRTIDDQLSVKSINIGAKSHRIVIRDDQGTNIEDVPEDKRHGCCLSKDMALRLGNLAVKIEKHYKSQRDIEWGIWNNNVYILQSRPVTSGTKETDFEIMHEFDGPLRCENDYLSVCNIGEVMPGATSPLGMDVIIKFFSIVFQRKDFAESQSFDIFRYFPVGVMPFYNHMMFTLAEVFRHDAEGVSQATMIAFLGRIIDDPELFEIKNERYGKKRAQGKKFTVLYNILVTLFFAGKRFRKGKKHYKGYRIPVENYRTSKDLYTALLHHCSDLSEAMMCHMFCTQSSTIWNLFVFSVLKKAKGGYDDEVYRDFALLMANCSNVESADVPSAMQSLAFHISKDINPVAFKEMSVEDAFNWLKASNALAGEKFRDFLLKHGHRCIKEFDVRSFPWGTKPEHLVKMLQNIVGSVKKDSVEKEAGHFKDIASKLSVSLGFFSRLFLKILLPQCQRAVQNREGSKSLLIKGIDCWRKGYHQLAKLMVAEGRIPDPDLMFFLTIDEIGVLLNTRSPKLLARAVHRQKLYPQMDKYLFDETMKGLPKPINMDSAPIISTDNDFMMKGIPVSQGVTKGFVRVALTVEEASHLKTGEILLTYCTDIGWTPYFPLLSGVVTELGGLISHGAVVSREYGLPCIAGLHGATRQFQTGDYVLLDGNKGILQKLPAPDNIS